MYQPKSTEPKKRGNNRRKLLKALVRTDGNLGNYDTFLIFSVKGTNQIQGFAEGANTEDFETCPGSDGNLEDKGI